MLVTYDIMIDGFIFILSIHFIMENNNKGSKNCWITTFYLLFLLMENYELFWNN